MIPFNRPNLTGEELDCIGEAAERMQLSANGEFTARCQRKLEEITGAGCVLLTHSCTAALEMAAFLAGVRPGDEVIMPSFTFVSTANAIVLRGGVPVFVDVRPDTLNLDENLLESAITERTRAISVVHYAGVGANMEAVLLVAQRHGLAVIEDAAQGMFARYKGRHLGTFGALGAISFHETKNVTSGEGGALLINDPALMERAAVLWEKGTNRSRFRRGEVDRYTWQSVGSAYAPSEITAAFLWAQLQRGEQITQRRRALWAAYHAAFADLETAGLAVRPSIPEGCEHNAHLYRLMLPTESARDEAIHQLWNAGVHAVFHYVPLHSSPAGLRYGRTAGSMRVTCDAAARLLRLPFYSSLSDSDQARIIESVFKVCRGLAVTA